VETESGEEGSEKGVRDGCGWEVVRRGVRDMDMDMGMEMDEEGDFNERDEENENEMEKDEENEEDELEGDEDGEEDDGEEEWGVRGPGGGVKRAHPSDRDDASSTAVPNGVDGSNKLPSSASTTSLDKASNTSDKDKPSSDKPSSDKDKDKDKDGKRHTCPHCQKRFNRPSSLKIHLNTHTGAKRE
jgi:hypothetical protein